MWDNRFLSVLVSCSLLLSWASCSVQAAPQYSIVALDILPGTIESRAFGLNDQGQAVGDSRLDRSGNIGQARPVVWDSSGQPTELWSEPLIGGSGTDINNNGVVVGRYGSGSGIPLPTPGVLPGRAFVWDSTNGRRDLGIQPFGNSMAAAINNSGQVVGTSEVFKTVVVDGEETLELEIHPFIWDADNGIRDLGTLGGNAAFAEDMNEQGQVVGRSTNEEGFTRAFVWDETQGMRELLTLGQRSQAVAINDLGQVLGFDLGIGAVIWDLETGLQQEVPFGLYMNNRGQLLGGTAIFDERYGRQMLSDLIPPNLEWEIDTATALNEAGGIVGFGTFHGDRSGFLMTPVPEPSSMLLSLTGIATIAAFSRIARRHLSKNQSLKFS